MYIKLAVRAIPPLYTMHTILSGHCCGVYASSEMNSALPLPPYAPVKNHFYVNGIIDYCMQKNHYSISAIDYTHTGPLMTSERSDICGLSFGSDVLPCLTSNDIYRMWRKQFRN